MVKRTLYISGNSRDVLTARAVLSTISGVHGVTPLEDGHTLYLDKNRRLPDIALLTALERAGVSGANLL